jgi:hypothetical protein
MTLYSLSNGQYFGQFLIANRRIRVSRLQGNRSTNGKSRVLDYEVKTVRTIVVIKVRKTVKKTPARL